MNADLFPENGGEQLPWKPPSQINEMKRQKLLLNHFAVTAPNIYTTVGNNLDRHVAHKIILSALFFFLRNRNYVWNSGLHYVHIPRGYLR